MQRKTTPRPVLVKTARPPSRFNALLDFVIRHAGAVSIDATAQLPPFDRISGRAGLYRPRPSSRHC